MSECQRPTKQLTTYVGGDMGKTEPSFRMQTGSAILETIVENPQKAKNKSTWQMTRHSTSYFTDTCSAMITVALLTIARKWK